MVFIDDKQSLKSAKHDFETAYIRQVIEANDCRLRKAAEIKLGTFWVQKNS